MEVKVVLSPWVSSKTGPKERVIDVKDGTRLGELLELLAREYGDAFKDVVQSPHKGTGMVVLRNYSITLDMNEELSHGDLIGFALPLTGG